MYEYALSPRSIWRRFKKNKLAMAGLIVFSAIAVMAVFAPIIMPYDPNAMASQPLLPPNSHNLLGTDNLGRDMFSRMILGARIALLIGLGGAGIATAIGVILGTFAGYFRGWIDELVMRITDIILVIPSFFLFIMVISVLRDRSALIITAMLGVLIWPRLARIVRSEMLSLREREFTKAAKAIGASDIRIMFRHLLPNAVGSISVTASMFAAVCIMEQATLSFLGLGNLTEVSWGAMLELGKSYITTAWWLPLFPGIMIFLLVLSFNMIGDGLRDALDPRLRGVK